MRVAFLRQYTYSIMARGMAYHSICSFIRLYESL
jgi:hypothetical protein